MEIVGVGGIVMEEGVIGIVKVEGSKDSRGSRSNRGSRVWIRW